MGSALLAGRTPDRVLVERIGRLRGVRARLSCWRTARPGVTRRRRRARLVARWTDDLLRSRIGDSIGDDRDDRRAQSALANEGTRWPVLFPRGTRELRRD